MSRQERQIEVLQGLSLLFLAYAKSKDGKVQEVQSLAVDGHVMVSVNGVADTEELTRCFEQDAGTRARLGMTLKDMRRQSRSTFAKMNGGLEVPYEHLMDYAVDEIFEQRNASWRSGIVPHMIEDAPSGTLSVSPWSRGMVSHGSAAESAGWFARTAPGQIHLLKGNGIYHAEQHLLTALAYRLYEQQVPEEPVVVWGVKPPCKKCGPVVKAFANALKTAYGVSLVYNSAEGQGTEAAQIDLSELKPLPSPPAKFTTFLTEYAKERKLK
jgi:hypothetical protein